MAEESYPEELLYHPEHDWVRFDGEEATFGITWYAQDTLGELVFFDPPEVGAAVTQNEPYAEIESVKAVSDVYAPLSGQVVAVNDALSADPQKVRGWHPVRDGVGHSQSFLVERPSGLSYACPCREKTYAPAALPWVGGGCLMQRWLRAGPRPGR